MAYRYYGGTRESSVEQDLAALKRARQRGKGALRKFGAQLRIINITTLLLVGLFLAGVVALIVWGIQNLAASGFSWQLLLMNPITWIVLAAVGGITAVKRA